MKVGYTPDIQKKLVEMRYITVTVKIERINNNIVVQFSYYPAFVEKIKKIAGHIWHPDKKFWTVPYTKENMNTLQNIFSNELADFNSIQQLTSDSHTRNLDMPEIGKTLMETEMRLKMCYLYKRQRKELLSTHYYKRSFEALCCWFGKVC